MLSHDEMQRIEREERRVIEEEHYREQIRQKVSREIRDAEEAEKERLRQQEIREREERETAAFWRRFKRNAIIVGTLVMVAFFYAALRA